MFTPELQKAIGDAAVIPDGDHLFIGNGSWMMLLLHPELFIEWDTLDLIREFDPNNVDKPVGYIDWLILNAVGVDHANMQFLPAGMRRYRSIHHDKYQRFLEADIETIRKLHQENNSYTVDPRINLSKAFREGQLRPIYASSKMPSGSSTKHGNQIEAHHYQDDEYAIGVAGYLMEICNELELELYISKERTGTPQAQGAMDLDRGIVLLASAMQSNVGDLESPDGRKMWHYPSVVCWYSTEDGYNDLSNEVSLFDPYLQDQETVIDKILSGHIKQTPMGVDILRWHGEPEQSIRSALEDAQMAAWPLIHQKILDDIENQISRLEREMQGVMSLYARKAWKSRVDQIGERIDRMNGLMCEDLNTGRMVELIQLVQQIETD